MYIPLRISARVSSRVFDFIRHQVEWTLQDVHAMFRLPLPDLEIAPACNVSIVLVLLSQVSGLSTVFFDAEGTDRKKFIGLLESFYPWPVELWQHAYNKITASEGSEALYDFVRNPF